MQEPQLIILDEPTSVLTPQEADKLFETLERLRDEGKSILYISHRLEEVKRLCDSATVLRHGKVVHDGAPPRPHGAHDATGHEHVHPHTSELPVQTPEVGLSDGPLGTGSTEAGS